jgi:hypothetical protein
MKQLIIAVIILILPSVFSQQKQAGAQAFDEIVFLDTLGKKNISTVNDALKLFKLVLEKKQPALKDDSANNVPLKKGFIALMVASNLNLTDSVIFTLFKKERYAFRACAAHNLLNADGSENDLMSGEDLIEFLQLASEYKDKGAAK